MIVVIFLFFLLRVGISFWIFIIFWNLVIVIYNKWLLDEFYGVLENKKKFLFICIFEFFFKFVNCLYNYMLLFVEDLLCKESFFFVGILIVVEIMCVVIIIVLVILLN